MENLNLSYLPAEIKKNVASFFLDILSHHKENIVSIYLTGSAITKDFDVKHSDINTLIVVKEIKVTFFDFIASLGKQYGKKKLHAPLVMTKNYIERSLAEFPLEFLDMKHNNQLAYGEDILKNIVSGVVGNNPNSGQFGLPQIHSGPYRFYGDAVTPINSYGQLAQAWANFVAYGAAKHKRRAVVPTNYVPPIINSGLNQFSPARNDEISRSWELGRFAGMDVDWSVSNLLPVHVSGTIGDTASPNNVMTVVSINNTTSGTSLSLTEPTGGTDANAIKAGDLFQFVDGVSGQPNMRFLTFIGQHVTSLPVQFRATADAATVAGAVTVSIETINGVGLVSAANANQNVNNAIVAGMKVIPQPSHQAGWMDAGDAFYLAMPKLPDQSPFQTVSYRDADSGAAIRHYWGTQFGLDNRSYVRDIVWGSTLVSEDSMRLLFPL